MSFAVKANIDAWMQYLLNQGDQEGKNEFSPRN